MAFEGVGDVRWCSTETSSLAEFCFGAAALRHRPTVVVITAVSLSVFFHRRCEAVRLLIPTVQRQGRRRPLPPGSRNGNVGAPSGEVNNHNNTDAAASAVGAEMTTTTSTMMIRRRRAK